MADIRVITPEEVALAMRKMSLYVQSADSPIKRFERKQEVYRIAYSGSPAELVDFAKRLPDIPAGPAFAWHVTYFYLATGMEGRPDEEDHGIVLAPTAEEAKRIVAQRCSKGDASLESWYMTCLRAVRYG